MDLNQPNLFIQIKIKEETKHGEFNDSLYYTWPDFENLTQEKLDDDIKARVSNWINYMDNPPEYVEPTEDQLKEQKIELQQKIIGIDEKLNK